MVLVFRSHEEVLDGMSSFAMHLNAIFFASSFDALTKALVVRHYNVYVGVVWLGCVGTTSPSIRIVTCCCSCSHFDSVDCPLWIFAFHQSLIKVPLFILKVIGCRADGVGSMVKCAYHTVFAGMS